MATPTKLLSCRQAAWPPRPNSYHAGRQHGHPDQTPIMQAGTMATPTKLLEPTQAGATCAGNMMATPHLGHPSPGPPLTWATPHLGPDTLWLADSIYSRGYAKKLAKASSRGQPSAANTEMMSILRF